MKYRDYLAVQANSSAWTRRNDANRALAADAAQELCRYVDRGSAVLEVGCGDGYFLDVLRGRGFTHLCGVDVSFPKLVVALRSRHSASLQDAHELAFRSGSFDAVYCAHTLEHCYDGYRAVQEIARVLRPGGLAMVIVPDHTRSYGETYVPAAGVVPLEERSPDHFDRLLVERGEELPTMPRNQFPFSPKLLLAVLLHSGLSIESYNRVMRNGPELWATSVKSMSDGQTSDPIVQRSVSVSRARRLVSRFVGLVQL